MSQPITDRGYEALRLFADLSAQAVHHQKAGRPEVAETVRRTVEVWSAREQTKIEAEASIRRAVREVSRW